MMRTSEFMGYLKQQFPTTKFYNGAIDKNEKQCVGVYSRGEAPFNIALGGKENTSHSTLPISILVHWTENADLCETMAQSIYEHLFGLSNFMIGAKRVVSVNLMDSCPVNVGRDDKNIAEMVIRLKIIYER